MTTIYNPLIKNKYFRVSINRGHNIIFCNIEVMGKRHRCAEFKYYFNDNVMDIFSSTQTKRI